MDVLGLIKVLVVGFAFFISSIAFTVPYWFVFTVQISYDAGITIQDKNINVGLYTMDGGSITMTSLQLVHKATNARTLPPMFELAQLFYTFGDAGMFVAFVASVIYFMRKYKTVTGEILLAGLLVPSSLCLLLGVIFAVLSVYAEDDFIWESFPVPDNYMKVEVNPEISINFGLYIAAVGALVGLIGMLVAWMQACTLCKHIEGVRYQMLHAPMTAEEKGAFASPDSTYTTDLKPGGFRYDGYSKPRVEEVDF